MVKLYYFTIKDYVSISAIVVACYVVSIITKTTIGAIPIPGMKTILGAFFNMLIVSIGLMWIGKIGALTLIQLIRGILAGFIFPAVPFLSLIVVGGIAGDLVTKLLKGSYENKKYVILACSINEFIIALVLFYFMILIGYPKAILRHEVIFGIAIVSSFLAMLSAYIGTKIAEELGKAGVM